MVRAAPAPRGQYHLDLLLIHVIGSRSVMVLGCLSMNVSSVYLRLMAERTFSQKAFVLESSLGSFPDGLGIFEPC